MSQAIKQKDRSARDPFDRLQTDLEVVRAELAELKVQNNDLREYIRAKTNQLLNVIGTLGIKPEELDDDTILSLDPIGIVSDSFTQVLDHLHETNTDLSLARDEIQAIFDSAGAGILVVDSRMRLITYNQKSQELFFPDQVDVLGQNFRNVICPEEEEPEECIFDLVLARQQIVQQTDFVSHGRHYHVIGNPIKDQQGTMTHVVLIYTDISDRIRSEEALQEAETRLTMILNSAQAGILLIDPETHRIVFANQAAVDMTGTSQSELKDQVCHNFICPAEKDHCPITDLHQQIDNAERHLLTADGRTIPVIKTVSSVDIDGKEHLLESFIDITERKEAEEKLRQSEDRYRTLYSTMQEGVALHELIYNDQGLANDYRILDVNKAYETILGMSRDEVIGLRASEIYPLEEGGPPCLELYAEVAEGGQPVEFEYEYLAQGSSKTLSVSVAQLSPGYFATVFEDITERKEAEEKIEQLAYFDSLTGLPNRTLLRDRLGQLVARAKRLSSRFGLFFLDLDRFKQVNDTFGHDKGDQLLQEIADKLKLVLRDCDTVARLGGDEFVLLVDDLPDREAASLIACKIHGALAEPMKLEEIEVFVTTSIGVAIYPEDGDTNDLLLKNADTAMYQAKEVGRNTYRFYSAEMNAQALERLLLANDLRKALEQQQFHLAYQPQIDLEHGQMTGIEALLRWQHPDLGNIPPDQFIPLAEETGMILPIGHWVIETACAQAKEFQLQCGYPLRIAVNLSAKQFQEPGLTEAISRVLARTGLAAETLELEITESILMENVDNTKRTLNDLKFMGIKLAIDDFGTGYSSLSYLRNFPIDRLKIDKSFVQGLTEKSDNATITEAIIVMSYIIGIRVVAEGVEHQSELEFLRAKKCDEVQGFYFCRPLTVAQMQDRIAHPEPLSPFCFFKG